MGRPEKPVDRTVPARAKLADFLRERKAAAGLTYEQMAARARPPRSKATFERAGAGARVPSLGTVYAAIQVTVTDEERRNDKWLTNAYYRGKNLWLGARRATRAPYYVYKAPDPNLIASEADLSRLLRNQHVWAGAPSPREMARVSSAWLLPPSTSRRIIAGDTLPVDPQQTIAFLYACSVDDPTALGPWLDAAVRARKDSGRSTSEWLRARQGINELVNVFHDRTMRVLLFRDLPYEIFEKLYRGGLERRSAQLE
ncbi:helix-turn-helix domain-containing protein [Streptomyces sp. NPDC047071]|uniref:helix-turn-helix domain-containing protein n=1 Tax=Streptomyces sp. NPDC047071 TaxID=3154808 RepID=UPI00345465A7